MYERLMHTQAHGREEAPNAARRRRAALRCARWALSAHLALTAASMVALSASGVGASPAGLTREPYTTADRISWMYTARVCIALGVLAHAAARLGARRALTLVVLGVGIAYAAELSSTSTGGPFGEYRYTAMLGPLTFGLVPLAIPLSWCLMAYAALGLAARIVPPQRRGWLDRGLLALVAALALLAWDRAMDPAMSAHWTWVGAGPFGGGPASSWLGWLGTGG